MEERLEDGELGLQGRQMRGAEGGAMGCVGGIQGRAVLEGGEANTAASRHYWGEESMKNLVSGITDSSLGPYQSPARWPARLFTEYRVLRVQASSVWD